MRQNLTTPRVATHSLLSSLVHLLEPTCLGLLDRDGEWERGGGAEGGHASPRHTHTTARARRGCGRPLIGGDTGPSSAGSWTLARHFPLSRLLPSWVQENGGVPEGSQTVSCDLESSREEQRGSLAGPCGSALHSRSLLEPGFSCGSLPRCYGRTGPRGQTSLVSLLHRAAGSAHDQVVLSSLGEKRHAIVLILNLSFLRETESPSAGALPKCLQ